MSDQVFNPTVLYRPGELRALLGRLPVNKILETMLKEDYIDEEGMEPELHGLSQFEVMVIRQIKQACRGNGDAFNRLMDRTYGKPMQRNENLNVNMTMQDYLDSLPDPDNESLSKEEVIDDVEFESEEEAHTPEF